MAGLKLNVYGAAFSTATMRVLAALHEEELDFKFIPIDMRAGEHKKEYFLSLNLFGLVPAFESGDLKLFESRAITKYIAREYSNNGSTTTKLIPTDAKKIAIMDVWMEVEAHQFEPAASGLVWELVVKPMFGMVKDQTEVEGHEGKLGKILDIYEARLGESKYLGGTEFSLADLHHIPNIHYLMGTHVKKSFESRQHVHSWCQDILARPAWSKVIVEI